MEEQTNVKEVKDISVVTKEVSFEIPAAVVGGEFDQILGEITKSATVKGYRQGKAPKAVIEKMYSDKITEEVRERLIKVEFQKYVDKEGLAVYAVRDVQFKNNGDFDKAASLEFSLQLDLFPNPEVSGYDKFSVEVDRLVVDDKYVDNQIKELLNMRSKLKKVEFRTEAREGDYVDLDLIMQLEGEDSPMREPAKVLLKKGESGLPSEIEEVLPGLEVGSAKEVDFKFTENHKDPKVRGKSAHAKVCLNAILEKEQPELDDEFVKSLNLEEKTVDELKKKISEDAAQHFEKYAKEKAESEVLAQVAERNPFELPPSLVEDEIRNILVQEQWVDPEKVDVKRLNMDPLKERFGEVAEKRLRIRLSISKIADNEKVTIEDEDIEKWIKEVAEQGKVDEAEVKRWFTASEHQDQFRQQILDSKVLSMLMERTTVKYNDLSTEEAEKKAAEQNAEQQQQQIES